MLQFLTFRKVLILADIRYSKSMQQNTNSVIHQHAMGKGCYGKYQKEIRVQSLNQHLDVKK